MFSQMEHYMSLWIETMDRKEKKENTKVEPKVYACPI